LARAGARWSDLDPNCFEQMTEIVVPASISNLGPAFDALSVAVDLYLRVVVLDCDRQATDVVRTEFSGLPPGGPNKVEAGFRAARERCGIATPGLRIRVASEIPARAGLGSSAAAAVAGIRLYQATVGSAADDLDVLALAAALEGHPDNAAAAILGGLAVSCQHDDGRVTARSSKWPADLRFVVATPGVGVDTPKARAVLPDAIPLRDAVFNLQRALRLQRAIGCGDYGDLREALRDRWHQPRRAALVPGLAEALAIDDPAVLGVCLCGSGPTVAALVTDGAARATGLFEDLYRRIGLPCTIRTLNVHQSVEYV
jgi:homoserine kinase